jgi:hypothetical protein
MTAATNIKPASARTIFVLRERFVAIVIGY